MMKKTTILLFMLSSICFASSCIAPYKYKPLYTKDMRYSLEIKEWIYDFDLSPYQINIIVITNLEGEFGVCSQIPGVVIFDSNFYVRSFLTEISGAIETESKIFNSAMIGYFTSDAFDVFSGNVTIGFGYYGSVDHVFFMGEFENINIHSIIIPLNSLLREVNAPMGDNAWLKTIKKID